MSTDRQAYINWMLSTHPANRYRGNEGEAAVEAVRAFARAEHVHDFGDRELASPTPDPLRPMSLTEWRRGL